MRLKSNMDRFIDLILLKSYSFISGLKSNMDRFIDIMKYKEIEAKTKFKIQYG